MDKSLQFPIAYLERHDFSANGDLLINSTQPTLVMIQKNACPACVSAKPEFQTFANYGIAKAMSIQLDGPRESEKKIGEILEKIYPGIRGVPSYLLFVKGKKIPYHGPRDALSLVNFVKQF